MSLYRANASLKYAKCVPDSLLSVSKSHIHFRHPPLESRHATIRRSPKSWGSFFSTTCQLNPAPCSLATGGFNA